MRNSLALREVTRDSINQEIAQRTQTHQAKIAEMKSSRAKAMAAGAPPAQPLVVLANGDSWFDYPLSGNDPSLTTTDVVTQLQTMGNINPVILNIAHFGEATTDELSLPKQQRMIQILQEPDNWMDSGTPDVILISGGGNDIAGNQFCIFLDYATSSPTGLDDYRFQKVLGMVEASYKDLFLFRDRYARNVPIVGHCYDFPVPNGVHPVCAGPWLKPSLDFCGWNQTQGTAIVKQALSEFRTLLLGFANDPTNNFILVDTQGTLTLADWANELHPFPQGFNKIAGKFLAALQHKFPGRI